MIELTKEQFIQRLIEADWTRDEALKEYQSIQEEPDESGYDGP